MAVVLVGNKLVVKKQNFDKIDAISNVGLGGATLQINLGPGINAGEVSRIVTRRTAGTSGEGYSVFVFDSPTEDPISQVIDILSEDRDRIDIKFDGNVPFQNSAETKLYVKIVPQSANHSFQVRIQGEVTKVI